MTKTFRYTNNSSNLFGTVFMCGLAAFAIYAYGIPDFGASGLMLLLSFIYLGLLALLSWVALSQFRMFFRLLGQERLIIIDDQSVTFPELGDSLNVLRLSFSQIREIYFGQGRYGQPDNLIIKYDLDGHAYIQRDALHQHDFEAICDLFKLHLEADEIELR